jgi:hypothetical protein
MVCTKCLLRKIVYVRSSFEDMQVDLRRLKAWVRKHLDSSSSRAGYRLVLIDKYGLDKEASE